MEGGVVEVMTVEADAAPTEGSLCSQGGAGGCTAVDGSTRDMAAAQRGRMHHACRLVGGEAWVGICHLVAESLFAVGDAVGKDHADGLVQVVAAFGRAADVQVDKVPQSWAVCARSGTVFGGGDLGFDDGPGRVAALADEGLGARLHASQVVWYEEELDSRLVWVFDDDLKLPLFGDAITAARWRLGRSGGPFGFGSFGDTVALGGFDWALVCKRPVFCGTLEILITGLQFPLGPLPFFRVGESILEIDLSHIRTWSVLHLTPPRRSAGIVVKDG